MYTYGIRINAKLVKEGSFRINAKLVKEELKGYKIPSEFKSSSAEWYVTGCSEDKVYMWVHWGWET